MSGCYLGIDTSNYTTSCACFDPASNQMIQHRQLLPVSMGQAGLRQSDAVFSHTKQLPDLIERLFEQITDPIAGIAVSSRPRDVEGSYMPCFVVGETTARILAASHRCPLSRVSHQTGHLLAALYSIGGLSWREKPFLAFHVSGGTTEVLHVTPDPERIFHVECVGGSLDLKAGQAIDRVGVMLGLPFPAGPHLAALAEKSDRKFSIKPFFRDCSCSLSGIENQTKKMFDQGESQEDIARYTILSVAAALDGMTARVLEKFGPLPLLYAGGVMANTQIRERLSAKYNACFAEPALSGDNACGVAVAAALLQGEEL